MSDIYDVRDFGATPDDSSVDSAAIQAAIDAAFEAGGGTVWVPAGTYYLTGDPDNSSVGAVELRSNVILTGDGIGQTILKLVDGFDERINGIVRTSVNESVSNVTISNLTIDGNRENNLGFQTGVITGVKESSDGRIHENITISNIEVKNANGYGINPHEITYNLIVENSISHHNGVDGFVADHVIGGTYRNNLAYSNDRHGFNATTSSENVEFLNNEAYSNGGAGGIVQRGDIFPEGQNDIDWPSNITFSGGAYYDNGREGIFIKMADMVTIEGVAIYGNERQGIRVDGSTNTVIRNSEIYDNSARGDEMYDEIQIRDRDDIYTSTVYQTSNTQIIDNIIYSTGESGARYGIREESSNVLTGPSGTLLNANIIYGELRGDISVPGYNANPQPEPPETDFPPIFVGTTQAEGLDLSVFKSETISAAEGDTAISTRNKGVEATAKGTFIGETGVYTLGVAYFDENDGAAEFGVRINGLEVVSWIADEDFGTSGANSSNRQVFDITVELQQFDEIEIFATRDGNELARIDSVIMTPSSEPTDDNPMIAIDDFYDGVEDENLTVLADAGVLANDVAEDGGASVVAEQITTTGGGTVVLEADGSFRYTPLGDFFGTDSFEYAAIDGDGDTDTATVLIAVEDVPEPPVTPYAQVDIGRMQAESMNLTTFNVEGLSAADGGEAISSRDKGIEASAKASFVGDDGLYRMTVAYFDESDGVSEMGVRINDNEVVSWLADQQLGVAGASSANKAAIEFDVSLNSLDTIEIFATRDGGELVRIDYFDLDELLIA